MKLIQRFLCFVGEFIFPKHPLITEIESMSPQQLYCRAQKSIENGEVHSIFIYKDSYIQAGLWELKYRKNSIIAKLFAEILFNHLCIDLELEDPSKIVLIPIPLSQQRYKQRGYNQSELLIIYMLKKYPFQFNNLIRSRHTPPQTSLSRKDRLKNVKNCFKVRYPEFIQKKIVILIDDVCTTGSTLFEAKKILMSAGAQEVRMYTVAH